jgi:DNA-binding transcriptional ArsR family regulator
MEKLTNLFKALSDPTRRQVLDLLKSGDKTPTELLARIDVSQPTLSHHLDILKRAGLVEATREGQFIRYSLDMSILDLAVDYVIRFQRKESKR